MSDEQELPQRGYDARLLRRLLGYLRPYRWHAAGALCLDIDNSGEATCVAHCSGDMQNPKCPGAEDKCAFLFEPTVPLCFPACEPLLYTVHDLSRRSGFEKIIMNTQPQCLDRGLSRAKRGEEDHLCLGRDLVHHLDDFEAIHTRHTQVNDN